MLVQVLSKGLAGGICDSLYHQIQSHLSSTDGTHAMMNTARTISYISQRREMEKKRSLTQGDLE